MSNTCQICCDKFNLSTRKPIKCQYCEFNACKTCCETYILGETVVKCMNTSCNRDWTRQFIKSAFSMVFVNGKLKKHREQVLFDQERALLPATQPIVERRIITEKFQEELRNITAEIHKLREKRNRLENEMYRTNQIQQTNTERNEFIRACPDGECRGFLSSQWKCGICQKWACPQCHEIKGFERDVAHECNPETLATARLISSDTRPCPKCGTGIFRVSGCFAKDTKITLWDGTIKNSQDICIGDLLIGDNGEIRTVEQLFSGEDDLYEIKQNNGEKYIVNSKHTLALKYIGDNTPIWHDSLNGWKIHWFDLDEKKRKTKSFKITENNDRIKTKMIADNYIKSLKIENTLLITVDDYLKLDDLSKQKLFGYKSCSGINYIEQPVTLDPYILGLWLGDGTHTHPIIATNDKEIHDYINNWCQNNDAELVKDTEYKLRIRRKGYTFGRETVDGTTYDQKQIVEDKSNPFMNQIKKYNLLGNKHIPKEYIMNSRENRLKLLAGIIDTDGHVPKEQQGKRVVIIQSNEKLSNQIIYLARSLGFLVNYRIRERKNVIIFNCDKKDYKDQFVINISGENLADIPTILPRKKCMASNTNKDYFKTSIEVTPIGKGNYYGWTVNDNNRFLLPDFTVVKNCDQMFCTQCHTGFNWRTGRVETNIHNPHYFEWIRRNGNQPPADAGINPCGNGGRVEISHRNYVDINNLLRNNINKENPLLIECNRLMSNVVRNATHLRYVILPRYDVRDRMRRNEELRIRYMRNQITEEEFKVMLQRNQKRIDKYTEIHNVLEILLTTVSEIIYRFTEHLSLCRDGNWNMQILNEINAIVDYTNECLQEISKTYSSKGFRFNYEVAEIR